MRDKNVMLHQILSALSAQFITRLLIVSYFIAIALGLIGGVDVSRLATPFLPETLAVYLMRVIVLALCGMVLFGMWRRPAALVLSLIVFWTSYITLYAGGEIGAFWRDLALIGGLLLTANISAYADRALAEDWDDEDGLDDAYPSDDNFEPDYREDLSVARAG